MRNFFLRRIFIFFFGSLSSLAALEIPESEAEIIGQKIFVNECSGKKERLVWWNEGEQFASLGIGHFIWYPKNAKGPFEETFPSLIAFFEQRNVALPAWLTKEKNCPWSDKRAFLAKEQNAKKCELQELLFNTVSLQALFIVMRLNTAIEKILASLDENTRAVVTGRVDSLKATAAGRFALIDYLHFKGDGMLATEQYNGKGWGLKQVLENMERSERNPLQAFSNAAKTVLRQRVLNAPPERGEERWLKGWLERVERYPF